MRISDWSSDVCSSDLAQHGDRQCRPARQPYRHRPVSRGKRRHQGARDRAFSGAVRQAKPPLSGVVTTAEERSCRAFTASPTTATRSTIRSEEHTSELQSLMRISYAVFCLKKTTHNTHHTPTM